MKINIRAKDFKSKNQKRRTWWSEKSIIVISE